MIRSKTLVILVLSINQISIKSNFVFHGICFQPNAFVIELGMLLAF